MLLTNPFYYLDNFQRVLDSITHRYEDFFNATEAAFIHRFSELPQASRALTVRMIMRKPRFFLADDLQYTEIGGLAAAMSPLLAAGWVTGDPELRIDELFTLFTKPRLVQLLGLPRSERRLTKTELLERRRALFAQPQKIGGWSSSYSTPIYRLDVAALCERLRLLYFGNFRQSWSQFVLADLGVTRFEHVDISQARPFQSRRHWENFEQLYRCREMLHRDEDPAGVLAAVPACIEGCGWLESRRQRLLFRVGQALERKNETAAALAVYGNLSHPGASVRAIRIRAAHEDACAALSACEAAIEACPYEHDVVLLHRMRLRLRRRLGEQMGPQEPDFKCRPALIDMVLEQPATPYCVELEAANFLMRHDPQTQVFYVENCLMNSLFGLLCWRALFAPVEGAFFHPFHREPADLGDARFFERRQQQFAGCLAELDDGTYRHTILRNFEAKYGIDNVFVAWPLMDESLLRTALDCMAARHLKPWFELMARDFHANRAGFPDLIQLWPEARRYRLLEVKAPGDRLQDNQRRALALCGSFDIPVAVCKVKWRDRD